MDSVGCSDDPCLHCNVHPALPQHESGGFESFLDAAPAAAERVDPLDELSTSLRAVLPESAV